MSQVSEDTASNVTRAGTALARAAILLVCVACVVGAIACQPDVKRLEVGPHIVFVDVPAGWEYLDYGREHHFRKGMAKISIQDMWGPSGDLAKARDRILAELGHDERRSIASSRPISVHGHEALVVDSWDRFSHEFRKRIVLIANERSYLVMVTQMGRFEDMEATFDGLLASMMFPPKPSATQRGEVEVEL